MFRAGRSRLKNIDRAEGNIGIVAKPCRSYKNHTIQHERAVQQPFFNVGPAGNRKAAACFVCRAADSLWAFKDFFFHGYAVCVSMRDDGKDIDKNPNFTGGV